MPRLTRKDGVNLEYALRGAGDRMPLLLTHGYSLSGRMWDPNVAALAQNRMIVTWDLRGHGGSDAPDDPAAYATEQSLEDMAALLDRVDAERAILGGQSLGGYLSLRFAHVHPDRVAGLVLVDTGPGFRDPAARENWNQDARSRQDGAVREILVQHDSVVLDFLREISVPTLIVVGSEDGMFLPASEVMERRIPGARRVVIEGAGHVANADAPDEFNHAVGEFLEEL